MLPWGLEKLRCGEIVYDFHFVLRCVCYIYQAPLTTDMIHDPAKCANEIPLYTKRKDE